MSISASASDIIFAELHTILEQPIQLSPGIHVDFAFRTEFAHFPDLGLLFLSTKPLQHLKLPRYLAPVSWCPTSLRLAMGLSHLTMLAARYRWLPLAAENQRNRKGWNSLLAAEILSGEIDCPTSFTSGGSEAALWSMKHVVGGCLWRCAKGATHPTLSSHTHTCDDL